MPAKRPFATAFARRRNPPLPHAQVLLVCSPGGHLLQLRSLRGAWGDLTSVWVTLDRSDARSLLKDDEVVYAYGPTIRNVRNFLRNLKLAWQVVHQVEPAV